MVIRKSSGHVETKKAREILKDYFGVNNIVGVSYEAFTNKFLDDGDNVYSFYWTNLESERENFSVSMIDIHKLSIHSLESGKRKEILVGGKGVLYLSKKRIAELIVQHYEEFMDKPTTELMVYGCGSCWNKWEQKIKVKEGIREKPKECPSCLSSDLWIKSIDSFEEEFRKNLIWYEPSEKEKKDIAYENVGLTL